MQFPIKNNYRKNSHFIHIVKRLTIDNSRLSNALLADHKGHLAAWVEFGKEYGLLFCCHMGVDLCR